VPIFLVRHGETVCNAARIVQPADAALSAKGIEQAERVARRLAEEGIGGIRSSDLPRASETARRIAVATGLTVAADEGLRERNYGAVRGTPYASLDVDIFGPDYRPPGGETWAAFHDRVDSAWSRAVDAAAQMDRPLVVVTHGLVCYSVLSQGLVAAPGWRPTMHFANASVTIIDGPPAWRARVIDSTAHLRPEGVGTAGPV
jgi:broad specificity phosphatase PhoE